MGELIPLALWTVDDPGDRRTVMSALAWMASAGAVYLARERRDLGHALEWVDRTITLDLRATAAMRGTEFAVLSERRPDLAARLRRSLGTPASQHDRPDEPLVDVIREVRESGSGFGRFLLPRTAAEITAGLRTTTVILAAGPREGVLLVATPQGAMSAMPMSMSFDEIAELVTMSLSPRGAQVWLSHERLRSLVLDRILPDLRSQAADGGELLVVPVGVMNWLPIQPVAARAGLALELRPALTSSTSESKRPGPPLVVHSHGRGRKLDAGLEESKRVAAMLGVEPVTDPVDLAEVGDRLGSSSFVHFACHGVADVADPDASGLRLGPRDEDRLTVRALAATMTRRARHDSSPCPRARPPHRAGHSGTGVQHRQPLHWARGTLRAVDAVERGRPRRSRLRYRVRPTVEERDHRRGGVRPHPAGAGHPAHGRPSHALDPGRVPADRRPAPLRSHLPDDPASPLACGGMVRPNAAGLELSDPSCQTA